MRREEAGSFLVVEAILVAVIILTAILFFTSVQRPTAGSEARGVDLGQVATDTLGILQRRNFTGGSSPDVEEWVTKVLGGDAAKAALVDDFVGQVLPIGSRHYVRLSNGVGSIDLLPTSSPGLPRGARAAEVPFFPHWRAFNASLPSSISLFVSPGQPVDAATVPYQFTAAGSQPCIQSPTGSSAGPKGPWASATYWKASPGTIPAWAMYGVWKGFANADCTGTATYLAVTLPGAHALTDGVVLAGSLTTLTSASAPFTQGDVGRLVLGTGFAAGTVITQVTSTTATLSKAAVAGTALSATLAPGNAYPLYGLQLVVWFGA
ncbi:MAG TPA: hypothetical protein VM286_06800 [Candidatus Thermoplasmatota archaeon]|nr:hypothetical protein [Candidatus Thermoplasmatota archaeon]